MLKSAPAVADYAQAVIAADCERMRQASQLAANQLGPMPDIQHDYDAYVDYIARHNELAREILARLV